MGWGLREAVESPQGAWILMGGALLAFLGSALVEYVCIPDSITGENDDDTGAAKDKRPSSSDSCNE